MKDNKNYIEWCKFINDIKYSKYFVDNITKWKQILEEVKLFIDTYNKKTLLKNNKILFRWVKTQKKNFKQKKEIMKNDEIYNLWNEFVNDDKYKKYFDIDNVRDWKIKLEEIKQFIDANDSRPTVSKNESLCNWINAQIQNYKTKKNIMKHQEIYLIWHNFVNSIEYSKYFIIDVFEEWKNNLNLLKEYLDTNFIKPTQKTNKKLHSWMQHQVFNFKNKKRMMNNEEIYNLWNKFVNDPKYINYFNNDNIQNWKNNLEILKNFMNQYNKRPTEEDNKDIKIWLGIQIHNFKYKKQIMKNEEIYNLWNEFINDNRYKKYFDFDNIRDWKNLFESLKTFIDTNNIRPTDKTNKKLSKWTSEQIQNYRKNKNIMKNIEIRSIWVEFINSEKYKNYFDLDNIKEWKNMFDGLKLFIDINLQKPSKFTNKILFNWLTNQNTNYKKNNKIMKNIEIRSIWAEFINSKKYNNYF
jgi:hypothetical protein